MITPKASNKLMNAMIACKSKEATKALSMMVAASNILITDITKNGEVAFETLEPKKQLVNA